jgi:hypothetical protein
MSETITIKTEEYNKLKKKAEIDLEVVDMFKRAMEDLKAGRVTEWKSKK